MTETVIGHVLGRLKEIGVDDVFGVAGDYAFPVNDAIVEHPAINWIGCCNELNAGYAADGYARMRGVGALCTTYGVGELAALSAIAGSYAEHLAVFHLIGTPNLATQEGRALVHHTLGNGEFDLFSRMAEAVVCASAIMTPQNAASGPNGSSPRPSTIGGLCTWRFPATWQTCRRLGRRQRGACLPVIPTRWLRRPMR
jgi:indolepyruvate decarboxylase